MNTSAPTPMPLARRRSSAFTLIELLTVIAIIGILAAILVPTVSKVRATAQKSVCASNLRQVGIAMLAYTMDNKAGGIPGYYKITDKGGTQTFYGIGTASGATSPQWYADNGEGTRSLPGQLLPYLAKRPQVSGSTWGVISVFVCPANTATADTINVKDGIAPSYAMSLKVKATEGGSIKIKRPFAYDGKRSVSMGEIVSPRTAVALFDTDQEFVTLVGTSAISNAAASSVHNETRNVLFFDGHVASVNSKVDPYEKL